MSISEQVNALRSLARLQNKQHHERIINRAADTIEALSAELDELVVRIMVQENLRSGEMVMKGLLDGAGLNTDTTEPPPQSWQIGSGQ